MRRNRIRNFVRHSLSRDHRRKSRSTRSEILEAPMDIKIESRYLQDVVVLVPGIFQDDRGFFMETFRTDQIKAHGLPHLFAQDNHSRSVKGVVRGLHFQCDPPMGKLMRVSQAIAFQESEDITTGSPTLGALAGVVTTAQISQ